MIKSIFFAIFLAVLGCAQICGAQSDTLPDAIIYAGQRPGHIIVVDKSEQLLYLYANDKRGAVTLEKIVACSTGKAMGDKMAEGDNKTPDGFYILNEKKLPTGPDPIEGILAYITDYPNFWDAHLGRGGRGIWLGGTNKALKNHDSNGGVALQNVEAAALEQVIELYDTPVIIYEHLAQAPVKKLLDEANKVIVFLDSWARAWAGKDHAAYRDLYSPDFVNSDKRDFKSWMKNKEETARKQENISLSFEDLKIYRHRDVVVALFIQNYGADGQDISKGLKRLYLKPTGDDGYQIIGEEFQELPDKATTKWLTAEDKKKFLGDDYEALLAAAAEPDKAPEARPTAGEGETETAEATETPPQETDKPAGQQTAGISGKLNLNEEPDQPPQPEEEPEDKVVAETLELAGEAALAREESRVELEAKLAKKESLVVKSPNTGRLSRQEIGRGRNQASNPETEADLRALAAARAKLGDITLDGDLEEMLINEVKAWALAWNSRDTDKYFSYYHPDFFYEEKGLDLSAFVTYRQPLIQNAGILEIELSHFSVRVNGDTAEVMFRQKYRSDQVRDVGRKTLLMKKTDDGWKIMAETWQSF